MGDFGGATGALSGIGTIFNFIGNQRAAGASVDQGAALRAEADFEAAQMRQAGGQQIAASQRDALEQRRRATLIASRAIAVAAASGGSVSDPTISHLIADIQGEGAYRAGVALYQGEEKARTLNLNADAKSYEGRVMESGANDRASAYEMASYGALATGAASLFGKYGMGGPKRKGGGGSGSGSLSSTWLDAGTEGYSNIG